MASRTARALLISPARAERRGHGQLRSPSRVPGGRQGRGGSQRRGALGRPSRSQAARHGEDDRPAAPLPTVPCEPKASPLRPAPAPQRPRPPTVPAPPPASPVAPLPSDALVPPELQPPPPVAAVKLPPPPSRCVLFVEPVPPVPLVTVKVSSGSAASPPTSWWQGSGLRVREWALAVRVGYLVKRAPDPKPTGRASAALGRSTSTNRNRKGLSARLLGPFQGCETSGPRPRSTGRGTSETIDGLLPSRVRFGRSLRRRKPGRTRRRSLCSRMWAGPRSASPL